MSKASDRMRLAAVIVAAGKGLRAGQPVPKQFAIWRGKPVVRHSVEALQACGVEPIVVVIPEGAENVARKALEGISHLRFTTGGETRQASVLRGLTELERDGPNHVLIHDAARPIVPHGVVERLSDALTRHDAAIPALRLVDSIANAKDGMMDSPADRDAMRRVQTPQAFRFDSILQAHRSWQGKACAGDDAQVALAAGIGVAMVEGDEALQKLTFESDFGSEYPPMRIGSGFDVHRLEQGRELWLCGVKIDHDKGLAGHSDADVAIHALVDALLGAVGAGDIGDHFPPSDPQWEGAASVNFLSHAADLVRKSGYRIGNVDVTIICEAPKIGPHRLAMRENLSQLLAVDIGSVSVKASTTERLGFTGRGEGISAQAVVSLVRN